jgi:hypothetical protein
MAWSKHGFRPSRARVIYMLFYNIIYCLLQKPYLNELCIDEFWIWILFDLAPHYIKITTQQIYKKLEFYHVGDKEAQNETTRLL